MQTHLPVLKRPRAVRALVALLLALALLSACAGPGAQAPTPDGLSPAPTDPAITAPTSAAQLDPSGDGSPITVGFAAQEFERQQYEPLIAAFNAQNPDIRVQFVPFGGASGSFSFEEMTRQIVSSADTAAVFFLRPED